MMPLAWKKKLRPRKALGLLNDAQVTEVTKGHTEPSGEEAGSPGRAWGILYLDT